RVPRTAHRAGSLTGAGAGPLPQDGLRTAVACAPVGHVTHKPERRRRIDARALLDEASAGGFFAEEGEEVHVSPTRLGRSCLGASRTRSAVKGCSIAQASSAATQRVRTTSQVRGRTTSSLLSGESRR